MEENRKMVVIPSDEHLVCCGYCCGDCIYMDLNSRNNYDEAWCGKYDRYYSPSADASSCSYYKS